MSLRIIPDLLERGLPALDLPRRSLRGMIGTGFPDVKPEPAHNTHDPASAQAAAWRRWYEHVQAGRIG